MLALINKVEQLGAKLQSATLKTQGRSRITQARANPSETVLASTNTITNVIKPPEEQIVEDTEWMADVKSSDIFAVTAYPCNPGLSNFIPRGSNIAQLFDQYEILSLQYIYEPTSGPYAPASQTGEILLLFDFDSNDVDGGASTSTVQSSFENAEPKVRALPYRRMILTVPKREMDRFSKARFVRSGPIGASVDPHTYDAGQLAVCRSGAPSGQTNIAIGRLYVKYKIRFFHAASPGIPRQRNTSLYYAFQSGLTTGSVIASGTPYEMFRIADAAQWSTTTNLTAISSYSPIISVSNGGTITIASGVYLITFTAQLTFSSGALPTQMSLVCNQNGTPYAQAGQNLSTVAAETSNNVTCGPFPVIQNQNWTLDNYVQGTWVGGSPGVMSVANVILTIVML